MESTNTWVYKRFLNDSELLEVVILTHFCRRWQPQLSSGPLEAMAGFAGFLEPEHILAQNHREAVKIEGSRGQAEAKHG